MTVRKREDVPKSPPSWHEDFLALLPAIRRHAGFALRGLPAEAREVALQEVVCSTLVAYRRLVDLGKAELAYASVLARYAVAHARSGRQVGGPLNGNDVLSRYAQVRHGITIERLDQHGQQEPAEVAAIRIDFCDWLATLRLRQRQIATVLASSESTGATARRFQVTAGRISQLRAELHRSWRRFQGESEAPICQRRQTRHAGRRPLRCC